MAYDKFRQEATYEAPDVQPDQGLYKHAFATAMQQDFQRAEGDKNRDEAQKDAERKRLLALKPTTATAPFEVDAKTIGELAYRQLDSKMSGDETGHANIGAEMTNIQNITNAQKKEADEFKKVIDNSIII